MFRGGDGKGREERSNLDWARAHEPQSGTRASRCTDKFLSPYVRFMRELQHLFARTSLEMENEPNIIFQFPKVCSILGRATMWRINQKFFLTCYNKGLSRALQVHNARAHRLPVRLSRFRTSSDVGEAEGLEEVGGWPPSGFAIHAQSPPSDMLLVIDGPIHTSDYSET